MKKILILSAAIISLSAGTAMAEQYIDNGRTDSSMSTTSSTTSAYRNNSDGMSSSPLTGIYLGGYGGYDWTDGDADVAGIDDDLDGWDYGLFVGYKLDGLFERVDGLGIGMNGAIEASYGWSSVDSDDIEKNNEWSLQFRPGFSVVNEYAHGLNPYAILGWRRTEFEATGGNDEDLDGFELGIGTEFVAYGNLGVRVDYIHTFYEDSNGLDPDANDLRLGLAYHF